MTKTFPVIKYGMPQLIGAGGAIGGGGSNCGARSFWSSDFSRSYSAAASFFQILLLSLLFEVKRIVSITVRLLKFGVFELWMLMLSRNVRQMHHLGVLWIKPTDWSLEVLFIHSVTRCHRSVVLNRTWMIGTFAVAKIPEKIKIESFAFSTFFWFFPAVLVSQFCHQKPNLDVVISTRAPFVCARVTIPKSSSSSVQLKLLSRWGLAALSTGGLWRCWTKHRFGQHF